MKTRVVHNAEVAMVSEESSRREIQQGVVEGD